MFNACDLEGNEFWRVGEEVLPEGADILATSFFTEDFIFFHDKNGADYLNITPKWYMEKDAIGTDCFEIKAWEPQLKDRHLIL